MRLVLNIIQRKPKHRQVLPMGSISLCRAAVCPRMFSPLMLEPVETTDLKCGITLWEPVDG
jgi:hypothetical protein